MTVSKGWLTVKLNKLAVQIKQWNRLYLSSLLYYFYSITSILFPPTSLRVRSCIV